MEIERSNELMPNTEVKESVIEQEPEEAAPAPAPERCVDVVDQSLVEDVIRSALEEVERKPSKTEVKVEYNEDNIRPWQWSDEYDVKTVWVDRENHQSSKAKGEEEVEGEEDVIYENIGGVEEGEGEEGEEEYYLVEEEEEIIEEGVEDAHSEGMTNIEDEELIEEHLQAIKVHRKRKDYEVFVGGLDWYATQEDLREVFSKAGEVREIRLTTNAMTKRNEGFAFVRYGTVEEARRALDLKGSVVRGKRCRVFPSEENDTLFVSNICRTWTKEQFEEKLRDYGVDHYKELTLVEDRRNEGLNRGFAFLEFFSRLDAKLACRRLKKHLAAFGLDRKANVTFAVSYLEPDGKTMSEIRTVFINGMPPEYDEDQVTRLLEKYGPIKSVQLARTLRSAKRFDFAFIIYEHHKDAVACVKAINNGYIGEGESKRKVGATLYWPRRWRQRLRQKRGMRRNHHSSPGTHRSRGRRLSDSLSPSRSRSPRSSRSPVGRSRVRVSIRDDISRLDHESRSRTGVRDRLALVAVPRRSRNSSPSPERSYERRLSGHDHEYYYPRSTYRKEEGRRSDYDSRVVVERRPSYKDDYHYSSSERAYSSRHARAIAYDYKEDLRSSLSYREGHTREYDRSSRSSKRQYNEIDDDGYDESIRRSKSRYVYGSSSSSCTCSGCLDACSRRLVRQHVDYCNGNCGGRCMIAQEEMYDRRSTSYTHARSTYSSRDAKRSAY
ncbi:hypothetical protein LUZ63_002700 [Rhynchospora breviuscula]|uniref:RRM domain-containing protein n=1 Tax=Rhynchospora breviuscula TaxID=2022672 RepID=A0A9Q0CZB7_9POAL|nr:hypothetical protein LUZ63_002700 [Rhynchospora breviuscula]